ncbi:hypothetical protein AMTRI_Chr09g21520 [Amborella trichopoda]
MEIKLLRKYLLITESQVSKCGSHMRKYRKGRCSSGREPDSTKLGFGRYGTKSCDAVLANLPITSKAKEVRMGRGKANPVGWIARVSTGQIPFEMDGVSLSNARQAATLAAHKLCLSTKFGQWS